MKAALLPFWTGLNGTCPSLSRSADKAPENGALITAKAGSEMLPAFFLFLQQSLDQPAPDSGPFGEPLHGDDGQYLGEGVSHLHKEASAFLVDLVHYLFLVGLDGFHGSFWTGDADRSASCIRLAPSVPRQYHPLSYPMAKRHGALKGVHPRRMSPDARDSKPCGPLRQVNLTYMPN